MFERSWMNVAVLAALLLGAVPQSARGDEVIPILGGNYVFEFGEGSLDIFGNKGFTFRAGTNISGGVFEAWRRCNDTLDCRPGTTVDLNASWRGGDLNGTVTLKGLTYESVGSEVSGTTAAVGFSGTLTFPAISDAPVSVTVPFDFAGLFAYNLNVPGGESQQVLLSGGGRATFTLRPSSGDPSAWAIERVVFEFSPIARR